MPIIEEDVLLTRTKDGKVVIQFPITRLGNVEAGEDTLTDAPEDNDQVPVVDASDGNQMKKTTWAVIKAALANIFAAVTHNHAASDVTSGYFSVARGGTGRNTLTSGHFLRGNGTGAVTMSTPTAARQAMSALTGVGPTTITLTAAGWTGDGPWTQTVAVSGVTANDNHIHIYPVDTEDADARKLYDAAYGCLAPQAETLAGSIKFTCRDKKPEINFEVVVEGARV